MEQLVQQHREGKANRAVVEQALAQPEPESAPQWWCYESPTGHVGQCERRETTSSERLVEMWQTGKFDAVCKPQPIAFCAFGMRDDGNVAELCFPTSILCATFRADLKGRGFKMTPECLEAPPELPPESHYALPSIFRSRRSTSPPWA